MTNTPQTFKPENNSQPTEPLRHLMRGEKWIRRTKAAIILTLSLTLLLTAASLEPAKKGYGTHTQLGLQKCAFFKHKGLKCPTCGMTTSFTYAAHGQLINAFITQPAGTFFAILTAISSILASYILITASPIMKLVWPLIGWPRMIYGCIAITLTGWVYLLVMNKLFG